MREVNEDNNDDDDDDEEDKVTGEKTDVNEMKESFDVLSTSSELAKEKICQLKSTSL